jgi:hypothetical protein
MAAGRALAARGSPLKGAQVFSQWAQGGQPMRKGQCWAAQGPIPGPQRQEPVHDFTTPAFWKEQGFREIKEEGPMKNERVHHTEFPRGNAFNGRIDLSHSLPRRLPSPKIIKKVAIVRRDIKAFTGHASVVNVDRVLLRLDAWLQHNKLSAIDLIKRKRLNAKELEHHHIGEINYNASRMRRLSTSNLQDEDETTITTVELQQMLQKMSMRFSLAEVCI